MKMIRVWAMPNKWTFKIQPIADLLARYSVGANWADPFCGENNLCQHRNDLNPANTNAQYHMEAVDFAEQLPDDLEGVVFDPLYSLTQVSRSYNDIGLQFKAGEDPTGGFIKTRDILATKIKPGGHIIYFGWNSNAFGKKRGYEIEEVLRVAHGSNRNDTIVIVERRLPIAAGD